MLLLFWHSEVADIGYINDLRWVHADGFPPRFVCAGAYGVSSINPYILHPENKKLYAYAYTESEAKSVCYFKNNITIGTEAGIFSVPWATFNSQGYNLDDPVDFTSVCQPFYPTISGLLSTNIRHLSACGDYLGVVTDSGLSFIKHGTEAFINYPTASGKKVFVTDEPAVYFIDGNSIRIKYGEPADFNSWGIEKTYPYGLNDIKVSEGSVFLATTSGLVGFRGNEEFLFTLSSGSSSISSLCIEPGTTTEWGHIFLMTSGIVSIFNTKSKTIERQLGVPYDSFMAWGSQRLGESCG